MKSDIKNIQKLIKEVISEAKKSNRESAFVIITNVKKTNSKINFLPKRKTRQLVCGVVSIYSLSIIKQILSVLDGKVDYIFVDSEHKVKGLENLVKYLIENTKKSKVIPFKSSDSTVDSTDFLLMELLSFSIQQKVAIVGAGNIGSKVALKLVERGFTVNIARRDFKKTQKTANALNTIKPKFCTSKVMAKNFSNIAKNCDVLIGFTNEVPVISSKMVNQMNEGGIILDGGIRNLQNDVIDAAHKKEITIVRLDIRTGFAAVVELFFQTKNLLDNIMGKKDLENFQIVAGGLYGNYGDIVVDSITNPTQIIGAADGKGGILNLEPSNKFYSRLKKVKKWITNHHQTKR